jgi:hypothetical protein
MMFSGQVARDTRGPSLYRPRIRAAKTRHGGDVGLAGESVVHTGRRKALLITSSARPALYSRAFYVV